MAAISHSKSITIADGADANVVRPSDWNSGHAFTMIDAVSAGTQSGSSGTIVFANSNGVSWGLSGSSQVTATVQTNYLTNVQVSAGTTNNLLSAITFSNSNNVSFGLNASTLTGSVNTSLTNINVSAGTTSTLVSGSRWGTRRSGGSVSKGATTTVPSAAL